MSDRFRCSAVAAIMRSRSVFEGELGISGTVARSLRQAQIALITGDFESLGIKVSPQLAQYLDRPYY